MTRNTPFRAALLLTASLALVACEGKDAKAVRFAESGMAYLEEGDMERAQLQFNNALFQNGNNVMALRGAAQIAEENEDYIRQARMLVRLLEVLPQDIDANNSFARISLLAGEADRAREHAQRVLDQDPENVLALTTTGAILVLENRLEEATEILQQALERDPTNPEIFNLLAAGSIRSEDFEDAMATIDEGILRASNPETLLVVKLVLAERFEGREQVIDTFEQLIAIAPDNGLYRQRYADYYLLKDNDMERARQIYIDSLPLIEDKTSVITRIVSIDRLVLGDEAAQETLMQFIADNPENMDLRFALPAFHCEVEDFERCRREYETLSTDETLSADQRLRALNGIADVSLVQGDYEGAQAAVDGILEQDSANANALITQGQLLLVEEKPEEAIETIRLALETEPNNPEGLVYVALAHEQAGQTRFADASFARALDEIGYEKAIVDQYRAFLVRQGDNERALDVLERYVRTNPSDIEAVYQNAEAAMYDQRYAEAEETARRLSQVESYAGRAQYLLARALTAQERFEDALPVVDAVYAANPDDVRIVALRAGIMQELGRSEEMQAELRARIDADTAAASDYTMLGDMLRAEGSYLEAQTVAEAGVATFPAEEPVYVLAYVTAKELNNEAAARTALTSGIASAVTTTQLRTLLSNDLIANQEIEEAIRVLRSLHDDNALSPLTANNLASLLLDYTEDTEEALTIARRLEGTENPYFADTLAWAYFKAGQVTNAARYSGDAASGLPNNADVQYHHGLIEAAQGRTDQAREALTRARDAHSAVTQTSLEDINAALAELDG